MNTEKENVIEVEEKVQATATEVEEKKEKLFSLPVVLLVVVYLALSFVISWYFGMKQAPTNENNKVLEQKEETKKETENKKEDTPLIIDEIKLNIDDVRGKEFLEHFTYVLHDVYIDSTDHLIPDDKRNSTNLLEDDVTEFKFIYYLFERYGEKEHKKYNTNISGLYEVGAYATKYNYFKEYYEQVMGKKFSDQVVYKAGEPYRINGEYLYGKTVTALNPKYRLSNDAFSQIEDKYYFTVLVEELDDAEQVVLTYRVKLCVSIVNEKFMLNSIIVY